MSKFLRLVSNSLLHSALNTIVLIICQSKMHFIIRLQLKCVSVTKGYGSRAKLIRSKGNGREGVLGLHQKRLCTHTETPDCNMHTEMIVICTQRLRIVLGKWLADGNSIRWDQHAHLMIWHFQPVLLLSLKLSGLTPIDGNGGDTHTRTVGCWEGGRPLISHEDRRSLETDHFHGVCTVETYHVAWAAGGGGTGFGRGVESKYKYLYTFLYNTGGLRQRVNSKKQLWCFSHFYHIFSC